MQPRRRDRRVVAGLMAAATGTMLLVGACAGGADDVVPDDPPPEKVFNFPIGEANPGPMAAPLAYPNLSFVRPVQITHAPDGSDRVFVVEQAGRIQVFADDEAVTSTTTFLDIQSKVTVSDGEQGLLGLAFHPDYTDNGFFYVHYTAASPRRSIIARFTVTADPDVADPNSEFVLLTLEQPYANHNSGMLAFGPDDMLYIGFGDGGSGGDPLQHAQNRATLHGNILRVDVDGGSPYAIPSDNPFVGEPGVRGEIWAYGLRNPWRFSFDRQTGDLWVGDVGQGVREEIHVVEKGDNCGWRIYEGTVPFNNPGNLPPESFAQPRLDYPRSWGVSVIGGYVYRGNELPGLRGAYVFGDYGSGRIWSLSVQGGKDVVTFLTQISAPVSFGETRDGELRMVSHAGSIHALMESSGGGSDDDFPTTLSATGLFTDLATLTPATGLHEYEVNAPFWSDDAIKRRWVAVPSGAAARYHATDAWTFPVGTVTVKHFELPLTVGDASSAKRLETRVMIHQRDGWAGYTYRWNDAGTEATLLGGREDVDLTINDPSAPGGTRTQTWTFPGRTDCLQCHTEAAGRVLGLRTLQLERVVDGVNQVERLASLGVVRGVGGARASYPDPYGAVGTVTARARAYLAVNCAMCHVANGPAPTTFDMAWSTPEGLMGVFDVRPQRGDLGISDAWIARRGSKETSVLWERMRRLTTDRMPPLGSHLVDDDGVSLVGEWIDTGN